MKFKEKDLVLVRLNNKPAYSGRQRHYNVWLRVEFKDNDNSFHGKIERKDNEYELHEKGDILHLNSSKILDIFNSKDKKQWCYSDTVTRCDCQGLCRNK